MHLYILYILLYTYTYTYIHIIHIYNTSIFLLFRSHIKLDNSVAFRLYSCLKEFLCLYSLSLKELSVNPM